ncbi:MAG: TIGR02281 family clan AA aspartic protease [Dolichospermum sp.]
MQKTIYIYILPEIPNQNFNFAMIKRPSIFNLVAGLNLVRAARAVKISIMLKYSLSRLALIPCSVTLAFLTVACNQDQQKITTGESKPSLATGSLAAIHSPSQFKQPLVSPTSNPLISSPTQLSTLEMALDQAYTAKSISETAVSVDDWNLVIDLLEDAIALMKKIKRNSSNFTFAQSQIVEYRRQVAYARQKIKPTDITSSVTQPQPVIIDVPKPQTTIKSSEPPLAMLPRQNEVFIVPIKRRMGGTPIIEVTFNGTQQFEMIVDTGASGTVITQKIAAALGVIPTGKAKANTASAKAVEFPTGYLDSMEIQGIKVNKVSVAIAGTELETGLLGHDFFGNYDITIKRHVVEFRPQTHSELTPSKIELTVPTFSRDYRFVKFP